MNNFFKKLLISSFSLVFAVDAYSMDVPPPSGGERSQTSVVREMYQLPLINAGDIEIFRSTIINKIDNSGILPKITPAQAATLLNDTKDLEITFLTLLCLIDTGSSYMNLVDLRSESLTDYNAFFAAPDDKATKLMVDYQDFIGNGGYRRGMEDDIDFYLTCPGGRIVVAAFLGLGIRGKEDLKPDTLLTLLNSSNPKFVNFQAIRANLDITSEHLAIEFKENLSNLESMNFSINSANSNYSRLAYKITDELEHYLTKHKQGKGRGYYENLGGLVNLLLPPVSPTSNSAPANPLGDLLSSLFGSK